jgi:hypothetical protein
VRREAVACIRTDPEDQGFALVELVTGTVLRVKGNVGQLAMEVSARRSPR